MKKEIKKAYNSKRFEFVEISKDECDNDILVFQLDNCRIAFSYKNNNKYIIFSVKKGCFSNRYIRLDVRCLMMKYKDGVTSLIINKIFDDATVLRFDGRAFDFDKEMIIARLGG